VNTKKFEYQTETELMLKELKGIAESEKYFPAIESTYNEIIKKIETEKSNDINKFKNEISDFVANEIVSRYHFQKGRIEHQLVTDTDIKTAMEILMNSTRYKSILSGKK
jgi:carboxyl-terminal processing protease